MPATKTKSKKSIKLVSEPIAIRAKAYLQKNAELLEKCNLKARFVVTNRKKPGIIIKLALWVLRRTGSYVDIEFSSIVK